MFENHPAPCCASNVDQNAASPIVECLSRPVTPRKQLPKMTIEARLYAVRELARRAAVSKSFFKQWHITVSQTETVVFLGRGAAPRIHFLHASEQPGGLPDSGHIDAAQAAWVANATTGELPNLIIPFSEASKRILPLYESRSDGNLNCRLDVLASLVLVLSRVEETLETDLDAHGRVKASNSLAGRLGFLQRPILDEHGLAFQHAIMSLLPAWQPEPRVMRFKLTHDVDDIGIPFGWQTALAHTLKRRRPAGTLRDFLATCSGIEPIELTMVRQLAAGSKDRGLHSAFFWKASGRTAHDSGYSPEHPKVQRLIEDLRKNGFELGVHPGYETFRNRGKLASEVIALKRAIGEDSPGGRQHYLRWLPDTWLDWEYCGLRYDSSVGFADQFGFRAGSAFPYRPWCWEQNREINLIEVPLVLMDCTPVKYMGLEREEGLDRIRALVQQIKETGGVFTLLWHNTPLIDPAYNGWYEDILDLLGAAKSYEVPQNPRELW